MKKNDRVRHEAVPEWGLGRVLEDPVGGRVRIFFINVGIKKISLPTSIVVVTGAEAANAILDNLKDIDPDLERSYRTLAVLKKQFLEQFPGGFHGEKYLMTERNYKVGAHELAEKLLSRKTIEKALESKDFAGVCENARKVIQATNLVFPNEKMNFSDGVRTPAFQERFSSTLFELLFGDGALQRRFTSFCGMLDEIGAAKWTVATYFQFIMYPDEYMFMKPVVTSKAAAICAFELNYKPQLNWLTYEKLLVFSRHLKNELIDLKPRDMIDVQSFIWCTGEGQA
ncbi:MAG: DUF3553 domain-containing protein [Candidatus Binatus sp.]|uniref:DUF3553 domain-containing protein n=1 Tax=Candidatus Binatus sp. TaxID=2811406 RepID=UPI002729153D|nr:DUF3553 domain-containing protein [Candidatus Binatus sp.]MDO8433482.1 DUF3553 domain-containing protein [Candidatus Binatus sp.]